MIMVQFSLWAALAVSFHAFHSIFARRLAAEVSRAISVKD
jgi:hypothetical protein